VAGVAHELNNPLTAIVGYAQLLGETCHDPQICEDLERINNEAQRSARIVQNLLAFARQQEMEKRPIELGETLHKTIDLVAYQLQVDNVHVVRQIDSQPMIVYGDTYQLQQVFLNLITNAHQAMRKAHEGGTMTVRAATRDQKTVQVEFVDDGPGIPNEIIGRIFDPFFTTKDVGEGTGLGLSICLGIVQEHEGHIWAENQAGQGTVFTVELPIYQGTAETDLVWEPLEEIPSADQLSILVVDDEDQIARLLKRILEVEGHHVVTAGTGRQADQLLDQQAFDLIICDLKMPGMSGRELYAHLLQDHPLQAERVIFSTGDVGGQESWAFLQKVGRRYISKPFNPEQILAEVREAAAR
jgi:two-component system NtrC family sensor kinase